MKYGFSLFLQEYIEPEKVEYDDCRSFQIVCPNCKEPVFKVARKNHDIQIHYFSHYKKDETLNEQCELRVNRISIETINKKNYESKEQKLSLFIKVFQDLIWENEYDADQLKKVRMKYFQLNRSKTFSHLKKENLKGIRENIHDKNEFLDFFTEAIENIYNLPYENFSGDYVVHIQKEFAYSFLQYLVAGHSKTNYFFLINHAFIQLFNDLDRKNKQDLLDDWEILLHEYITRFFNTKNEKKRYEILYKMGDHQMISPYSGQDVDLFIMFASHIAYHSYAILLRIPYLTILQDKLLKKTFDNKQPVSE